MTYDRKSNTHRICSKSSNKSIVSWIWNECSDTNALLNIFVYTYGVKGQFFTEPGLHPGKERRNL